MKNKIVSCVEDETGLVLVEYAPDNGEKYTVVFQPMRPPLSRRLGAEWGGLLMVMLNLSSRPLVVSFTVGRISVERFVQETGLEECHARPLLELLNYIILDDIRPHIPPNLQGGPALN